MIHIVGGPVYRKPTHRVSDISFALRTITCACGTVVQVEPSNLPIDNEERLADAYREHRAAFLPVGARSHR